MTSIAANDIMSAAHQAMADLLGAPDTSGIVFGYNMTSLVFHFSRMIAHDWQPGDNIVLTRMDHDGNVAAWLIAAEEKSVEVRWLEFDPETFSYRYDTLDTLIDGRTRLVACNHASNFLGTLNDVTRICAAARAAGAVSVVDAVQSVPHVPIDVQAIGCDALLCSAYKFFGPHAGILAGRLEWLEGLQALKVRPAADTMPYRFELGTPSFEAEVGTLAAVEHFAWLGETQADVDATATLRSRALAGIAAAREWENGLAAKLLSGLTKIDGLRLLGIGDAAAEDHRVPTFTFTVAGHSAQNIAAALAERNIFVWAGSFYAYEAAASLGLDRDGAVRIGLAHYNDTADVDACLAALAEVIAS